MENRTQCVFVEGHLSDPLDVVCGVPQGSILGPLLYLLYTNDLPESIHEHHLAAEPHQELNKQQKYNTKCQVCGRICLYADDSTFTISNTNTDELTSELNRSYRVIAEYMTNNKLILNSDKTHLMVMTSTKKHSIHQDFGIYLDTGTEIIFPQSEEKLLGALVSNCLNWNNHIRDNSKSLIAALTSRVNALSKVCEFSSFKTRKMVANGIFMSYLSYLMPLYGGCPEYLLNSLQILQNRAARLVTKSGWYTPSAVMLQQVGWLNVHQLITYHSLVLVYKTRQEKKPVYIYEKISTPFSVNTRLANTNGIRNEVKAKSNIAKQSFLPRTVAQWNRLPPEVRTVTGLEKFKSSLRQWIKLHY